ncbi:hypothetical protein GGR51DRAFT_555265 [Nemania sp. FL0031]|nr:hypothetical protein GGR51DRAFT_555265 [Nemania sp. FL0031]
MCHGHPQIHPCYHTSVKWLYCPEAIFDMATGYETPCSHPIYSAAQPVNTDCPLKNCNFKVLKGRWKCCLCGYGPNKKGWCTATRLGMNWNPVMQRMENMEVQCGHGCCHKCSHQPSSKPESPDIMFADVRKTRRKSHGSKSSGQRKSSTHDSGGGFLAVVEEDNLATTASSSVAHSSRGSRRSTPKVSGGRVK